MKKYHDGHEHHLCKCGHGYQRHLQVSASESRRQYCTRRDCPCRNYAEEDVVVINATTLRGADAREWVKFKASVEKESGDKMTNAEFLRRFIRACLKRTGFSDNSEI